MKINRSLPSHNTMICPLPPFNIITKKSQNVKSPTMVAFSSMGWLSCKNGNLKRSPTNNNLGILAFEAAKTASRLLSLYKSLSKAEIVKLRKDIIKSQGVVYLNSDDEGFLLRLACIEKIEDLDKAAAAVSRLGWRCSDFVLNRFDMIYADIKLGMTDLGKFEYGSSRTEKKIHKLKKFLLETLGLYDSLETLPRLEVPSERILNLWQKKCFPVQLKKMSFKVIDQKNIQHRKQPSILERSLRNQSFDKLVRLMSHIVWVVYARICMVFRPYVPDLPTAYTSRQKYITAHIPHEYWIVEPGSDDMCSLSRPMRSNSKPHFVRFYSRKTIPTGGAKNNHVFHAAGPKTLGWSGLHIRYANLILMAEECMKRRTTIKNSMRDEMYRMLPHNLKVMVKSKMRKLKDGGKLKPEGLREVLCRIFAWLVPMAHDTLKWQQERSLEKTSFDTKPTVMLLQTLHFADKEKAEAAIAEVLVGLSLTYIHEKRRVHASGLTVACDGLQVVEISV